MRVVERALVVRGGGIRKHRVREGAVIDARSRDPAVQGVRRLNQLIAAERRVAATAIQTVGAKGYDGFAIALVLE